MTVTARTIRALAGLMIFSLGSALPALALDISGASTVQPVVQKLSPLFTQAGGEAVKLSGGGSGAGIKDALSGASQIGMVSRGLKSEESAALKNTVIAIDALAIIVNRDNPLAAITKAQLVDLYTGKTSTWKALGGPDRPVVLVSKEVGRSTLELFENYVGLLSPDRKKTDKPLISQQAYVIGANLEALTLVGGMRGAIGYVSLGTAVAMEKSGMPVKILTLDGIAASDETIRNGSYPLSRPLNLVYTRETPAVAAFLGLALSPAGQDVARSLGFLPVAGK
jgi:phosphate transport system substrate-binding protein